MREDLAQILHFRKVRARAKKRDQNIVSRASRLVQTHGIRRAKSSLLWSPDMVVTANWEVVMQSTHKQPQRSKASSGPSACEVTPSDYHHKKIDGD